MKLCYYLLFAFLIIQIAICNKVNAQSLSLITNDDARLEKNIDSLNDQALTTYTGNPAKARKVAQNCLLLSKQFNYTKGMGASLLNIGKTYWAQSYYPVS